MITRIAAAGAALAAFLLAVPAHSHEGHDQGDAPPPAVAQSVPRAEAQSALFELVAASRSGSLEIYLDRFETNEPVTNALIDLETPSGPVTDAAEGDVYRLDAPWALQPGAHDLIFTVSSGTDIDFLTATLTVPDIAPPVVAQSSGWLVGSALASEMQDVLATDLRDRLSRNDPALIAVGVLGFVGGLLVMAVFRRRSFAAVGAAAVLLVIFAGSIAVAHEGHDHGDQAAAVTALSAGVALVPLMIDPSAPGKEILHPVAVTIFGGLVSSTLLDTFLTPVLFLRYGETSLKRLVDAACNERESTTDAAGAVPQSI